MPRQFSQGPRSGVLVSLLPALFAQKTVVWQSLRSEEKYNQAAALYLKGQSARAAKLYREACDSGAVKACIEFSRLNAPAEAEVTSAVSR